MLHLIKSRLSQGIIGISFLLSGTSFAVTPVPGWYGGLFLGPSFAGKSDLTFTSPITGLSTNGTISHSVLGNIGGQIGYRINRFRVEGELLANSSPYKSVSANGLSFGKASKFNSGVGMKGQTNIGAFLVNGFFDFVTPGGTSNFSPYLGIGIGYAYVENSIKFYNNNVFIPGTSVSSSSSKPAGQAIIGLGSFLDDFTLMGLDFRYLVAQVAPPFSRVQVASINLTFNGSFNL